MLNQKLLSVERGTLHCESPATLEIHQVMECLACQKNLEALVNHHLRDEGKQFPCKVFGGFEERAVHKLVAELAYQALNLQENLQ